MYRILIVDDEKTERECIRFLINESGIPLEIMDASDGSSALHILEDWPVDILFTDVQMPLMDGLELIRNAQRLRPDLKIIIFSGYADFEYARTAITLGVENYILKPVIPDELERTLSQLIRQLDEEQDSRRQLDKQHSFLLQYSLQLSIFGNFSTDKADSYVLEQLPLFQNMVLLHFNDTFLENNYFTLYDDLRNGLNLDMELLTLSPEQALLMLRSPIESPVPWGQDAALPHRVQLPDLLLPVREPASAPLSLPEGCLCRGGESDGAALLVAQGADFCLRTGHL